MRPILNFLKGEKGAVFIELSVIIGLIAAIIIGVTADLGFISK